MVCNLILRQSKPHPINQTIIFFFFFFFHSPRRDVEEDEKTLRGKENGIAVASAFGVAMLALMFAGGRARKFSLVFLFLVLVIEIQSINACDVKAGAAERAARRSSDE
jgi:hypothetical protein